MPKLPHAPSMPRDARPAGSRRGGMRAWLRAAWVAPLVLIAMAATVQAQPVRMLIGLSLPPYVIEREDRGLEYDIVKEALALAGHEMVPSYLPNARLPVEIARGEADAVMKINEASGLALCYSDSHITYQDYAITLASRGLTIDRIEDLAGKSLRAYQNASVYLGADFAAMARANPNYAEAANQQTQNAMLYTGRVDVVVGDINIFTWYNGALGGSVDTGQPVTLHPIFTPVIYKVGFRDPLLCEAFNKGLAELRRSGGYDAILARYRSVMAPARP